jgi:potassium efflux system protein
LSPAQDNAADEPLTAGDLEVRIQEIEASPTLADDTRRAVLDLYREALDHQKRADELAGRVNDFSRQAAEAPALIEQIRAELAEAPAPAQPDVPDAATLAQIEQLFEQARAELQASRRQAEELQAELERRASRRAAIPDQIAAARQRLATLAEALRAPANAQESADVAAARSVLLRAQVAATQREVEVGEAEVASYEARRELLPLRRDRALRQVTRAEAAVTAWEGIARERRRLEAERANREAQLRRQEAARRHPVLRELAEEIETLAGSRTGPGGITARIAAVTAELSATREKLATLRSQFRLVRRKTEVSGLTKGMGVLLRRQYDALEDASLLRRRGRAVHRRTIDAEYELIVLEEQRIEVGNIDGTVRRVLEAVGPDAGPEDRQDIEIIARELATARRDLLDQVIGDQSTCFDRLVELDAAARELADANEACRSFIEERILWVRSVGGRATPRLGEARDGAAWLLGSADWRAVPLETLARSRQEPIRLGLIAAGLLLLIGLRRRCRRGLADLAPRVASHRTDRFGMTARALLYTIVVAAPVPVLLIAAGWLLRRPLAQPGVAVAAGLGLGAAGWYFLALEFLRQALWPRGLAEAHFRWPAPSVLIMRRHLRWFVPVTVPLVFLVVAMDHQSASALWNDSLGRIAFMLGLLAVAVFAHLVLRPGGAVIQEYLRRYRGGWLERLRYVWYPLAVGLPLALIGLAWAGYYYTALRVQQQLATTVWLVLGLILVNAVMLRWLFVARRRIAIDAASRKRERERVADAREPAPALEPEEPDIPAIDAQTQRLFRTITLITLLVGLYVVWADVLPALRMLDRVQVWPSLALVEPEPNGAVEAVLLPAGSGPAEGARPPTEGARGVPGDVVPPLPSPSRGAPSPAVVTPGAGGGTDGAGTVITLADVGLTLVILLITVAAVRNLPALVEIVVLQRLPLDAGSRYALSTVVRYTILIFGIMVASGALGVSWSKVQWIVAALTFGLAFGLQEIFANFVSGLIILAERPVRVGDAVTVGGISGKVSRIRMRATTITDWDRKELIVPNKSFVTDQVVNWTLSDPTLRVTVPVGISYGADIDKAEEILLRVAKADESVLADPPPQALFLGFGDSTLNFEVRVFIPHLDHLLTTRHRLHRAITKAFREAGIEIAFPQRDLHVRSADGLAELVRKREDLAETEIPPLGKS